MTGEQSVQRQSFLIGLLGRLFSTIYSVERKSSEAQLREDFGEFPPSPLRCRNLNGNFTIARVRGIGEAYQDMLLVNSIWSAFDSDNVEMLSTDLRAQVDVDGMIAINREIGEITHGSRFWKSLLRSLAFGLVFIKVAIRDIRKGRRRPTVAGLFVPVNENESRVIIRSGRHIGKSDAPTISHEHIHLLQHKRAERHVKRVRYPELLIDDDHAGDPFVNYVLEKNEVEARLHELVLSFYRKNHHLPLTVNGFLGLLAASESMGGLVEEILDKYGVCFDRGMAVYPPREEEWVRQLVLILVLIRSPELQLRFMNEVMPVMYGNLLHYYGENVAEYHDSIQRPNLYDELYGELSPLSP